MIKIKKKLINFTKRYFLNFEFVERDIATRVKRIKKKATSKFKAKKTTTKFKKKTNKKTSIKIIRDYKIRNKTIKRNIRSAIRILQIIAISSNEFNNNNFKNFNQNSSDENFNVLKNKNENVNNN